MQEKEYDIYLHYPVNTDEENQDQPITEDWVLEFSRYLDITMERIMNKRPNIINSHQLEANVRSLEIDHKDILNQTALFIIFTSKEAHQNERYHALIHDIYETCEREEEITTQRVFKVELEPANPEEEHEKLKNALEYEFYEKTGLSKRLKTIDITEGNDPPDTFWSQLLDLSYDLIHVLSNFKDSPLLAYTSSIYLADVSPDQRENYDILKREFLQRGIEVFPDKKLPQNSQEIKDAIQEYLEKSKLSIHIIGERYGEYVPKSEYSITELQNKIVDEFCSNNKAFGKLIYIPKTTRIRDGKQKLFLERIRKQATDQSEIIQTNITEFRELVIQKLDNQNKSEEATTKNKQLYYITEPNEEDTLEKIQKIADSLGIAVISPKFSDSIVDNLDTHFNNLIESDMLVINYTNENPLWLQTKLQDSFKVFGMGKDADFKWKCILTHKPDDNLVPDHLDSFETIDLQKKKAIGTFENRLKEIVQT